MRFKIWIQYNPRREFRFNVSQSPSLPGFFGLAWTKCIWRPEMVVVNWGHRFRLPTEPRQSYYQQLYWLEAGQSTSPVILSTIKGAHRSYFEQLCISNRGHRFMLQSKLCQPSWNQRWSTQTLSSFRCRVSLYLYIFSQSLGLYSPY